MSYLIFIITAYPILFLPIAVILFFIIALAVYKNEKKKLSGSYNEKDIEKLKNLKMLVRVSGIIAAVFTVLTIVCTGLFFLLIAYM